MTTALMIVCGIQCAFTLLIAVISVYSIVKGVKEFIRCILDKGKYEVDEHEDGYPVKRERNDPECAGLYDKLERLVKDALSYRLCCIERTVDDIQGALREHRKFEQSPGAVLEAKPTDDSGFQYVVSVPTGLEDVFLKEDWPVGTRCLYKDRVAVLVEDKSKYGCRNTGCVFRQNGTCVCKDIAHCMMSNRADGKLVYWKFAGPEPEHADIWYEESSVIPALDGTDDVKAFLNMDHPLGARCLWKKHMLQLVEDKKSGQNCGESGCIFDEHGKCVGCARHCCPSHRADRKSVHWECVQFDVPVKTEQPAVSEEERASIPEEQQDSEAVIL